MHLERYELFQRISCSKPYLRRLCRQPKKKFTQASTLPIYQKFQQLLLYLLFLMDWRMNFFRRSACRALQTPAVLSAEFSYGTVEIKMDMLNDDIVVVRLQALEILHHMGTHDHLKVAESHLHMVCDEEDSPVY